MAKNKEMIDALLHELEHYEKYNKPERAKAVKDQLKEYGYKAPKKETDTKKK